MGEVSCWMSSSLYHFSNERIRGQGKIDSCKIYDLENA